MEARIATTPGKAGAQNEDWVGATSTAAVVLDGLSSAPGASAPCQHGTSWFVAHLGSHLLALLAKSDQPVREVLADAIQEVAGLHPECKATEDGAPSATVSLIRATANDTIDYLVLADARIVFEGEQGIQVVTDERVDEVATEERLVALNQPIGSAAKERALTDLIAVQKPLRNRPGGYWVAAGDPSAAQHAFTGCVRRHLISSVALLTDGASRIVDTFEQLSWAEALKIIREHGPSELIRQVRALEATDPNGLRWPRYKFGDDATIAYVELDLK